jgi:hypothetical protein
MIRRFDLGHHRRRHAHDVCQEVDDSLPVPENVEGNREFWSIWIHGAAKVNGL